MQLFCQRNNHGCPSGIFHSPKANLARCHRHIQHYVMSDHFFSMLAKKVFGAEVHPRC